jgi:hypothetical protein
MPPFLRYAALSMIALILVACGGGGGNAGSPSTNAKSFMEAFASLDTEKMSALICSAQADSADDLTGTIGGAGADIRIDVSKLTYTDGEVSGNNATVNMSGDITIEAQGQNVTAPIGDLFPEGELPMVNEGGSWKVCPPEPGS